MSGNLTEQEFLQIYDKYKNIVYNQTFRILGNREDADEATQDVFLRIYKYYEISGKKQKFLPGFIEFL